MFAWVIYITYGVLFIFLTNLLIFIDVCWTWFTRQLTTMQRTNSTCFNMAATQLLVLFLIHSAIGLPVTRSLLKWWSPLVEHCLYKCFKYSNSLENCCILFSKLQCTLLSESPTVEDKFHCHTTNNCISLSISQFLSKDAT